MRHRNRHMLTAGACLALILAMVAPAAHAFFPWGEMNQGPLGGNPRLIYYKWDFDEMVAGIPITFEGGDDGWTAEEQVVLRAAFQAWADVSSTYTSFRFLGATDGGPIVDPAAGVIDFINYVSEVPADELGGPLGITLMTFIPEDSMMVWNGQLVTLTGPRIIDCDLVISSDDHTTSEEVEFNPDGTMRFPLLGTVIHEVGHMLGLGHVPMDNFQTDEVTITTPEGTLMFEIEVDPPVWATRNQAGIPYLAGVTPTMYPFTFFRRLGLGAYGDGAVDLSPDDIAGITFMYPREDLSNFIFADRSGVNYFQQEARYDAPVGVPAPPISGARVIAWGDPDGNPATGRVPMYCTMTSLYEWQPERAGMFRFHNMFKRLENFEGGLIQASYTFTLDEITLQPIEDLSSTRLNGEFPIEQSTGYRHQTFVEAEDNINGLRPDEGAALTYDPASGKLVNLATGKSIDQILPGTRPMFGDAIAETVCPLNLTTGIIDDGNGTTTALLLKQFRDDFLMPTPMGAAVVDAYYEAAPAVTLFLLANPLALKAAVGATALTEWILNHWAGILATLLLITAGVLVWRSLPRRAARAGVAGALFLAVLLVGGAAQAKLANMSEEELRDRSIYVLEIQVVSAQSRFNEDTSTIETDVVMSVRDTLLGDYNVGTVITMTQPGGRANGIVQHASEFPQWRAGERAVVYFTPSSRYGLIIANGEAGKLKIYSDPRTGKEYVQAAGGQLAADLEKAAKKYAEKRAATATNEEKAEEAAAQVLPGSMLLEDYKDYVRNSEREKQKKQQQNGGEKE